MGSIPTWGFRRVDSDGVRSGDEKGPEESRGWRERARASGGVVHRWTRKNRQTAGRASRRRRVHGPRHGFPRSSRTFAYHVGTLTCEVVVNVLPASPPTMSSSLGTLFPLANHRLSAVSARKLAGLVLILLRLRATLLLPLRLPRLVFLVALHLAGAGHGAALREGRRARGFFMGSAAVAFPP